MVTFLFGRKFSLANKDEIHVSWPRDFFFFETEI